MNISSQTRGQQNKFATIKENNEGWASCTSKTRQNHRASLRQWQHQCLMKSLSYASSKAIKAGKASLFVPWFDRLTSLGSKPGGAINTSCQICVFLQISIWGHASHAERQWVTDMSNKHNTIRYFKYFLKSFKFCIKLYICECIAIVCQLNVKTEKWVFLTQYNFETLSLQCTVWAQ